MRITNENKIFKVEVDKLITRGKPYFYRFYVGFGTPKRDRLARCKPIIGLHGCFLKIFLRSQLLCTIKRDGNNHIFPTALVVVKDESENMQAQRPI